MEFRSESRGMCAVPVTSKKPPALSARASEGTIDGSTPRVLGGPGRGTSPRRDSRIGTERFVVTHHWLPRALLASVLVLSSAPVGSGGPAHAGSSTPSPASDPAPRPQDGAASDAASSGGAASDEATPTATPDSQKLRDLPYGETLIYRGRVKTAGLHVDVGRATLRVQRDSEGRPVLEARAFGEKFGYRLNTRIASTLDEVTLAPARHEVAERGTERRTKKLVFREEGADFIRLKHCKDKNCKDERHFVKQAKMHGPIPWGTERVHCTDTDCRHRSHYDWRTRIEHRYEEPYVDMLSAVYLARQVEFDPDAEPVVIPIVNDTRRWNVRVKAMGHKRVKVAAGTFDAVQLVLDPLPADDGEEEDEEFEGLFGLNGTIQIWVDRETRRPILIEGDVPFAFMNFHAKIELVKIEVEEQPEPVEVGTNPGE